MGPGMRPLSVLFTNHTLADRAGSELWVRDVARTLVRRGHRPIAFSLVTGPVAIELREATVPVVTDLANVAVPPDLIHGHHHVETLIAALHFPGVPIVHFCHGWVPWEERPLKHPAIVRYVAVDNTCADRLILEEGIPADRVDRLLNFVDLDRFVPRDPLPAKPRRGLIFSNHAREDGYAAVIREACREARIDVTIAGAASGRVLDHPESVLAGVDLVFAKGRAALESMAVGCGVVLADPRGAGPLVTSSDFDRMRGLNFGVRLLQERHDLAWYRQQIAGYDAADAAHVSARVRSEAGLDAAVDRLLDVYARALEDHAASRARGEATPCLDSQRAAARHLAWMASHLKSAHDVAVRADLLASDLAAAQIFNEALLAGRDNATAQRDAALAAWNEAASAADAAVAGVRQAVNEAARHAALYERAEMLGRKLVSESAANAELRRERDALVRRYEALPALRLRNMFLRVPLIGAVARRSARWLAARLPRGEA